MPQSLPPPPMRFALTGGTLIAVLPSAVAAPRRRTRWRVASRLRRPRP